MRNLYIISFGTSSSYRYYDGEEDLTARIASGDIRRWLCRHFPSLSGARFLDTARVRKIDPADQDKYMDYPVLDDEAIRRIERHLGVEERDGQHTAALNSNAPYDDIDPES